MFKIYFVNSAYEKDQVLMYDDTRDDDYLKLGNPKLHIEVNAAGTLDFELPSTNVAYSRIIPMVTELHVIKDNQKTHDKHIWFGRVLTIDTDLYGTKTIHCEGGLAYLNDCIYYDKSVDHGSWSNQKTVGRAIFARYESPTLNEGGVHVYGVSPNEASAVIANIMSGGSNYKENLNAPFKHLGRIAKDTDPGVDFPVYAWVNEPVVPSGDQNDDDYYFDEDHLHYVVQNQCGISNPNNMTAIDLISSMMSNAGGLFWVSKTPQYPKRIFGGADPGDAVYVMQLHMRRYYPAFDPDEGQTIQLGENLTDLTITDDGTTFFTAVHPHGQHVNSGEDFTLRGDSQSGTTYVNKRNWKIDPEHGVMYCPELVKQYGMIIRDLDVGTTNIYEQLVGMGISEIDRIPIVSKTVGGSWTSGVRELTVKGIDMSLYNADYSSIELTDAVRVLAPRHGIDTYLNVTAIDYDLQNVENTVFTLNAIKSSNEITNASPSYGSSSGPQSSGSSYVHPKHTEHDLGLYKFSNDNLGHVDSAVAVSKKDITALGIPGEDTRYEITSPQLVSGGFFPDGPVIALKGTDGHHSYTASPNTYTVATTDAFNSYNSGEEIVSNGDKYRVILDLDIFAVSRFYEESAKWTSYPIIIDSYISMSIQHIYKRFWVRIYTFARCNSNDMPTRAIVRQLDPNGQYSNIKWQVYSGSVTVTREDGIVTRFRIGIDSDAYGKISSITRPKVYTTNVTSAYGDTLGTIRHSMDINAIGVTAVDTILELSSKNASDVAFTGDYNDLSNKPAIPDISGKQDKSTAVTHSANTAVGSATKPVYVAANGVATPISHSINADVPANAKFTDTTYSDATQSTHGLMTAADKKKLDGMDLSKYLYYNSTGNMAKNTWYKFASYTCTQYYNFSTAIFAAGFNYGVMRLFRITAGTAHRKPVASRISISNITGDLRGIVGYIINGNTVNFFLKPETDMYGYVTRIGATSEIGDFITQTDLVAATTAEAASIVPFTAAGTDVAFSNHSNETDKMSNGTLRSGFYVNSAANSTSGYTWFRMATCKISGAYETVNTTFLITNGMTSQGMLSCGIRNGSTGKTVESCTLVFSARNGSGVPPGMFRIVAINSDTGVTYELWGQITARWFGVRYTVLDERNISGGKYNHWKLESHSDADAKTAPTTGNYYVNSTDTSIAATLTDSGWITCPLAVTGNTTYPTSDSTIRVRKYGKMVKLEGWVKYAKAFNNGHNVATIPDGYRPEVPMELIGVPSIGSGTAVLFYVGISPAGFIGFSPANSAGNATFNPAMSYNFQATYFID